MNEWLARLQRFYRLWHLGYLQDQRGIIHRYEREKKNWDMHIEKCKSFILRCADSKQKGHAVVLGSGWLLDVPLKELSQEFEKVTLVDIFHPAEAKRKIAQYANVQYIEEDITGGMIEAVAGLEVSAKKKPALLSVLQPYSYELPADADYVVSLNVLNQLDMLLIEYLEKYMKLPPGQKMRLSEFIQKRHIEILPRDKSCLISDVEEELLDEDNKLAGTHPLVYASLPEGKRTAQWKWVFDTQYMYNSHFKTTFQVKAVEF
ncbi:MAG: hypothetical protein R6U66_03580 [Bacteroidales bacterium]